MKKIIGFSLAVICIALILGLVIYDFANVNTVNNSNLNTTNSTLPENQTETNASAPSIDRIVVPDDYPTIQQAVDGASYGDTVFVREGQYNESVTIDKSLLLMGENKHSTIIDAHSVGPNVRILHDNVNVTGFMMTNTPIPAQGHFWFPDFVPTKHLPDIQIHNANYCHIFGNKIVGSTIGIYIEKSSQTFVTENEIANNTKGVKLFFSTNNHILNNVIYKGTSGIVIDSSNTNSIVNNTITDTNSGIELTNASGNKLTDNTLKDNFHSFTVNGDEVLSFVNNVDTSNTIDDKPIYYWVEASNRVVPSNASCIILVNCTNIIVHGFDFPTNNYGIILANTNNSIIENNKLASINQPHADSLGEQALNTLLFSSFNNSIEQNRANIYLKSSCNNNLTQNTGIIRFYESDFNDVSKNSITQISFVGGDWSGITLSNCSGNQIRENTITENSAGVWLTEASHNNNVVGNIIRDNAQGGISIKGGNQDFPPSGEKMSAPSFNLILNNVITANGNEGIFDSAYCTNITGNNLEKNQGWGILLYNSVNCSITGNLIEGFNFGGNGGVNTSNCIVIGNNITRNSVYNQYKIWFQSTYVGTFYQNNFLGPINIDDGMRHVWDNGNEGNYWIYNQGTDTNGDGISDVPYIIDENNQDNYALMEPENIETIPKIHD